MTLRADRKPTHRPHPVTRAELARRVNRSRGAITLALKTSLRAACLPGGQVDVLHPVLLAFAEKHWHVGPAELTCSAVARLARASRTIGMAELAQKLNEPLKDLIEQFSRPPLSNAVIPRSHVRLETFAELAQVPPLEVREACRGTLGYAVTERGLLDLLHPWALDFMHAHPFGETIPDGYLAAACVGEDDIDVDHPIARVYLARSGFRNGRLPQE